MCTPAGVSYILPYYIYEKVQLIYNLLKLLKYFSVFIAVRGHKPQI